MTIALTGGRAVYGLSLRPLACWDYGFESRRGNGCLAVVSVVCYVNVYAMGRSLVQRIPTECMFVCVCVSLSLISATVTLYTDNEHVEYLEETALREQEGKK
jgi:hypothetical protein